MEELDAEAPSSSLLSPSPSVLARFSVPAKVFLLGEYAALQGDPALLVTLNQRFELQVSQKSAPDDWSPHPDSPFGRLLATEGAAAAGLLLGDVQQQEGGAAAPFSSWKYQFHDPFALKAFGGFGASSAQFALGYRAFFGKTGWEASWQCYRKLLQASPPGVTPSGADLVAQWQGGLTYFDAKRGRVENLQAAFQGPAGDTACLLIFAPSEPSRKVVTHEHLRGWVTGSGSGGSGAGVLQASWLAQLAQWVEEGKKALETRDWQRLGHCMNQFGDQLALRGLEIAATSSERERLRRIPGVLGVKGSGAMQADVLLVLIENRPQVRERVQADMKSLAMTEWTLSLLEPIRGVTWHPTTH